MHTKAHRLLRALFFACNYKSFPFRGCASIRSSCDSPTVVTVHQYWDRKGKELLTSHTGTGRSALVITVFEVCNKAGISCRRGRLQCSTRLVDMRLRPLGCSGTGCHILTQQQQLLPKPACSYSKFHFKQMIFIKKTSEVLIVFAMLQLSMLYTKGHNSHHHIYPHLIVSTSGIRGFICNTEVYFKDSCARVKFCF